MFDLDVEINNIKNARILPLLNEVKSSFYQGNYRSAIVINYTAIILDVLDKLVDLSEIYQDTNAQEILKEIEKKRKNSKSSDWENYLFKETKTKTELIDEYEYDDLMEIKRQRNNAAHPMTTYDGHTWELKNISKETCQDVIRKSFEIVFLKPPILGRKINNKIIDFAKKSYNSIGITDDDFKKLIRDQYLNQLGSRPKEQLLKSLFKLIFNKGYDNQEVNEGRKSSYALLKVLISEDKIKYLNLIKPDIQKLNLDLERFAELSLEYSELKFDEIKSIYLADFIKCFPSIKNYIKDFTLINLKNNLEHLLDDYPKATHINKKNLFVMRCTTVIDTCKVHIEQISELLEQATLDFRLSSFEIIDLDSLYNTFNYYHENEVLLDFLFEQMTNAKNFYQANYDLLRIVWLVEKLSDNKIFEILRKFNENSQYYNANNLDDFVNEFVSYYKEKKEIDLSNHYLGAIYSNLNILSDEHPLLREDFDKIFYFLEDNIETHATTILHFKLKYSDEIKELYGNDLTVYPKLNDLLFSQ